MRKLTTLWALLGLTIALDAAVRQGPRLLKGSDHLIGRRVANVSFTDLTGTQRSLDDFRSADALVIAFTGVGCPLTKKFGPSLARLEKAYRDRNVAFLFVNPTLSDDATEQQDTLKKLGVRAIGAMDVEARFSNALAAMTTTDVFLLDRARTLIYRGAVSDQYGIGFAHDAPKREFLRDALEAVLAGRRPLVTATWAPGCELDYKEETGGKTKITYHNRISRIMQENCQECHRRGGLAPFGLERYQDVIGNAGMIRRVVSNGLMPPWFAESVPEGGHNPWANDRSLNGDDKRDLLTWLKSDRPIGDPREAPLPRSFPAEWNIGKPDHIIPLPNSVSVKADGRMPYVNLFVKTDFKEDRWVTATEIKPTFAEVVHHVLVFVIPKSEAGNIRRRDANREDRGFLAAYVPGNTYREFENGFAKHLPAGATLHFQLHYTPNGEAVKDRTELGLKFSATPPRNVIRIASIANHKFRIPPRDPAYSASKTLDIPTDVAVLSFLPHMHLRGKAFRYDLIDGQGDRTTLLNVPEYDFNWQLQYRFAEPRLVKAGSKIVVTGTFDNSAANPANPDPDKTVKWGPQTEDEMLLGYVEYYIPDMGTGTPADALARGSRADRDLANRFKQLDRNSDGLITPSELSQPALFAALDVNDNGEITLLEAGDALKDFTQKLSDRFVRTKAGGDYAMKLFERLDANGDNRLTESEVPPQLAARLTKADRNQDRVVTRGELEAALRSLRRR